MKTLAPFAGWTALITGLLALLTYILLPQLDLWVWSFAGMAGINALIFITIDRNNLKKAIRSRQALYGMNATVLVVVMMGILIFANLLVFRHKQQFDFTETGYFTIAPQTQKILQNLPREVRMTGFFAVTDPGRSEFQSLMDNFRGETDKIESKTIDPDQNPAITKQYGIKTYGTVLVESGEKSTQVKKLTEENLTNAILQVSKEKKKKVYFIEGHGELSIEDKEKEGYSSASDALKQDGFEVGKVLLLQTAKVPDDADLVIINGPNKMISEQEQEVIEAYLNRGGAVLLLLDPQFETGLGEFLKGWGVSIRDDMVVDPLSRLFGGDYAAPVINQYGEHGITKNFALPTIFPLVRSVIPAKTAGVTVQELLFAGANAWAESDYRAGKVKFDEYTDLKGPVSVAVAVTRDLPAKDAETKKEATGSAPAPKKANLVVIGDSDFATNQYFSFSGNGDFFSNTASWLMEEENLISIRPRERKNSPLALSQMQGTLTFVFGALIIPSAVFLAGVRVWWRRRRL